MFDPCNTGFAVQAKKAYKHAKARKDMNQASRQHHQLLHEVYIILNLILALNTFEMQHCLQSHCAVESDADMWL